MWKAPSIKASFEESDVHIWQIDVDKYLKYERKLWFNLSVEEQKRASQFVKQKDQQYYVVTHGICRLILSGYLSQPPTMINIGKGAYGKPILLDQAYYNLHFNLSHSANKALFAVSPRNVGVDIEYINPQLPFDDLVPQFMSNTEREQFTLLPDCQKCCFFYRSWTCKEAYVKAIGQGLSYPIKQVTLSFDPKRVRVLDQAHPHLFEKWTVCLLPQEDDYCSALVSEFQKPLFELIGFDGFASLELTEKWINNI